MTYPQLSSKEVNDSKNYSNKLAGSFEDSLYQVYSYLEIAIYYHNAIRETDSENKIEFHQVLDNMKNLLRLISKESEKMTSNINKEFGQ